MKKSYLIAFSLLLSIVMFSSCSSTHKSMREPYSRVEFKKADFTLSEQVNAEATSTRILMIDWKRLFNVKSGSVEGASAMIDVASIPVIGSFVVDPTANYALYELMEANPGYDVVFYPQYTTDVKSPFLGLSFIYKKTTVKVQARLGKL